MAISFEETEPEGKQRLYGWGFNYYFQLGIEDREDYLQPVKIEFAEKYRPKDVKHISCGYFMSAAILK
jgi:alpha-tubulin suppressor-like RCC1 family protein